MEAFYETERDTSEFYISKATNTRCLAHFHNSLELIYLKSGTFHIILDGKNYYPNTDDIVFIPSFTTHIIPDSNSISITVAIPKELLHLYSHFTQKNSPPFILDNKAFNNQHLKKYFDQLLEEQTSTNPLLLYGRAYSLLGKIIMHYPLKEYPQSPNKLFSIQIIEYLNENFKEKITLDSIAEHFHYSRFYFSKILKKTINCSLSNYLNTLRTRYIANKLEHFSPNEETNFSDFVLSCGFDSLSTFYRYFKMLYNASPHDYLINIKINPKDT